MKEQLRNFSNALWPKWARVRGPSCCSWTSTSPSWYKFATDGYCKVCIFSIDLHIYFRNPATWIHNPLQKKIATVYYDFFLIIYFFMFVNVVFTFTSLKINYFKFSSSKRRAIVFSALKALLNWQKNVYYIYDLCSYYPYINFFLYGYLWYFIKISWKVNYMLVYIFLISSYFFRIQSYICFSFRIKIFLFVIKF